MTRRRRYRTVYPLERAGCWSRCGEGLVASYAEEMLAIDCPACGRGHGRYPFPPGGLQDRTNEEVLLAFDRRVRHLHCLAKDWNHTLLAA